MPTVYGAYYTRLYGNGTSTVKPLLIFGGPYVPYSQKETVLKTTRKYLPPTKRHLSISARILS